MTVLLWIWTVGVSAAWTWAAISVPDSVVPLGVPAMLLLAVGSLLTAKRKGRLIGPLLVGGGSSWLVYDLATLYATESLERGPFPFEHLSAWLGAWTGALAFMMIPTLLVLFPDGVFSGRRRWFVPPLAALAGSLMIGALFIYDLPATSLVDIAFVDDLAAYGWIDAVYPLSAALILPAGLSLALRYRRSSRVEKQQTRWLLAGVSIAPVLAFVLITSMGSTTFDMWVLAIAVSALPLSIGFAVLRYHLYDLGRIVSRTVSYALVVGVLAGGVALVATIVGTRFETPLVVAATTLGVAALFNPLRRRIQSWVDRRFNRSRYDAEWVTREFAATLLDRTSEPDLVAGWSATVERIMEPTTIGVWTR